MPQTSADRHAVTWGRWLLLVVAVVIGSTLLSTLLVLQCAPTTVDAASPAEVYRPPADSSDSSPTVQTRMRNVNYHVDPDIVLHIRYLRGELVATGTSEAVFEDGRTYTMRIAASEIFIDTVSLSRLINRHVFGYRGAPIRDMHVSVAGDELIQKGKLGNAPFTIRSSVSVTPGGLIRLHPVDVKVLGLNADGLMKKLGLELDELLKVRADRGIRVEENDFILDVAAILPPPRVEGRLQSVQLVAGGMVQRFGKSDSLPAERFFGDTALVSNYMTYRGGTIRFGKLTMRGTDLTIVDADPGDRFEFYLGRYHEQLVAGTHRTTPEDGLVVWMPDLSDIH